MTDNLESGEQNSDLTAVAADLIDRFDSDDERKPHRQPDVLRCALHEHVCSLQEAADAISEAFDIDVSKSTIHRAKDNFGIRDPVTEGPFAHLLEGTEEIEPGQPRSFYVRRSDDTPVHPFDADCYEPTPMEGGPRDKESSITPRFRQSPDSQSTESPAYATNPDSASGTGVYKGLPDVTPSDYRVTKDKRDKSLVAPPSAPYSEDYPAKYKACGCGDCSERHFLDGDGGPIDCPTPVPVTLAGARRIYRTAEGANVDADRAGNDVRRGLQDYAKTMKADSAAFRADGPDPVDGDDAFTANGPIRTDDITTVLISLRPSPTDANDRLVTPYRLVQYTKDGWAEARDEIPRDAGDGLLTYVWTFAGTETWATPHVHWYSYFYDPDDEINRGDFTPMVTRYLNAAAFGSDESHVKIQSPDADTYDPDEVTLIDGVVRVEPDPLLADPEKLSVNTDATGAFSDVLPQKGADRLTDGDVQTQGAIYLAKQLPKLALKGAEPDAAVETAAFLDASDGRHTFGSGAELSRFADSMDLLREYEAKV